MSKTGVVGRWSVHVASVGPGRAARPLYASQSCRKPRNKSSSGGTGICRPRLTTLSATVMVASDVGVIGHHAAHQRVIGLGVGAVTTRMKSAPGDIERLLHMDLVRLFQNWASSSGRSLDLRKRRKASGDRRSGSTTAISRTITPSSRMRRSRRWIAEGDGATCSASCSAVWPASSWTRLSNWRSERLNHGLSCNARWRLKRAKGPIAVDMQPCATGMRTSPQAAAVTSVPDALSMPAGL